MAYLGNDPNTGTLNQNQILKYVATAGQTAFTGADGTGVVLDIAPTSTVRVFMNGVLLDTTDYTLTANTVTLGSAATVSDEIVIFVDKQFLDSNSYSKTETDNRLATIITTNGNEYNWNSILYSLIFGG